MITAIHIDDDIRSIELMKLAAADVKELELKASFLSGKEALKWLRENTADIVFLDVEMPEKNGIDLAHEMGTIPSEIIFITAHTGFAVNAFEACALDYLIKPIFPEKLRHCLERYLFRKNKLSKTASKIPVNEQVDELIANYIKEGFSGSSLLMG